MNLLEQARKDFANGVLLSRATIEAILALPLVDGKVSDDWERCAAISDEPAVDEAFQGFNDDPTADNATCLVREILKAVGQ